MQPRPNEVKLVIEQGLTNKKCNKSNTEIAFFGGSFTAIEHSYMKSLLQTAYPFVKNGLVKGIRISTRPDCIDGEILSLLKEYGVTAIELGAQSMCDDILQFNERGHTAKEVEKASALINEYGFSLGLQMMTGLYKSNDEKDIFTAKEIIKLEPETVRIYPTIIMKSTKLENLYKNGEYKINSLENSVALCAKLLSLFEENHINVIRLGLHSSENLETERVAGPWHPAFAQLCYSKLLYQNLLKELNTRKDLSKNFDIMVNSKTISNLIGQKRKNLIDLENLGFKPNVVIDENLKKNTFIIN